MEQTIKNSRDYTEYDYKEFRTDSRQLSLYLDSYECFGWNMDEKASQLKDEGISVIHLRRDRRISNKQELTRLQRNFEDCMNQISILEKSKTSAAAGAAIGLGIAGTAFMAGSVFAVTAATPVIWLSLVLAVPGFAGWALPLWCYRHIVRKRTQAVEPLIEDKYEEIYRICEKGNGLLA